MLTGLSDSGEAMQKWSDAGCSLKTDAAGHACRLDVIVRERAKSEAVRALGLAIGKEVSQLPTAMRQTAPNLSGMKQPLCCLWVCESGIRKKLVGWFVCSMQSSWEAGKWRHISRWLLHSC